MCYKIWEQKRHDNNIPHEKFLAIWIKHRIKLVGLVASATENKCTLCDYTSLQI